MELAEIHIRILKGEVFMKKQEEKNKTTKNKDGSAYSNLFSVIGLFVSFLYLFVDYLESHFFARCISDNFVSQITAFAFLLLTLAMCMLGKKRLDQKLNAEDPSSTVKKIARLADHAGYISIIVVAITMLFEICKP